MKSVLLMGRSASAVVHIKSTFRLNNSSENFPLSCNGWTGYVCKLQSAALYAGGLCGLSTFGLGFHSQTVLNQSSD